MGKILKNESFNEKVKDEINSLKESKKIAKFYLKNGYVNSPTSEYRLQFNLKNIDDANEVLIILYEVGISAKIAISKNRYIVYLNDYESIVKLLYYMGADKASEMFKTEEEKRHLNSNINRIVNFEVANIKKSTEASLRQISDIKKLLKIKKFEELDDKMKIVIEARLNNPTATMSELSDVVKISKSNLNHKLKKIKEMVE